jgi:hypothetical protein
MSGLWGWVPFVGMVAIIIAVGWAMFRNKTSKAGEARTEAATRANYEAQNTEDQVRDQEAKL